MCSFTILVESENQSVSGVTTICLMHCNKTDACMQLLDHIVYCGLWNVGPLHFSGCLHVLDIVRTRNMLSYKLFQSIPNMLMDT